MFSSMYACVRSVKVTRRLAVRPVQVADDRRSRCAGHEPRQRGSSCGAAMPSRHTVTPCRRCRPAPGRSTRRSRRARRARGPSTGRRRTASTAPAGCWPPPGRVRASAVGARAAARTSVASLVAPSASARHLVGEAAHDAGERVAERRVGALDASIGGLPAAPLASSSTVSLVLVQPSTMRLLNESATALVSVVRSVAGLDGGVGGEHREHRGHGRRQHRRALGHPPTVATTPCADLDALRPTPCARCRW